MTLAYIPAAVRFFFGAPFPRALALIHFVSLVMLAILAELCLTSGDVPSDLLLPRSMFPALGTPFASP
jgi:hypothetical protein